MFNVTDNPKEAQYNLLVTHIMQSWQWGEFRKSLGLPLKRYVVSKNNKNISAFQLTFHKIPFINKYVGYLPKGPFPDSEFAQVLKKIGKENNCAFIKIEPDVDTTKNPKTQVAKDFKTSPKTLFTKYNFVLDLKPTEEELLSNMHPKTRYNIRLAQKKGVKVEIRQDDEAFKMFLKLYFDTTKRQGYFGHNQNYHQKAWNEMRKNKMGYIALAFYEGKPLTGWMLLKFKDTLYYPYGGSSNEHRDVMHSNLTAWEAIKLGKKLNCKYFDMWGALGPDADQQDPWYGFHKFKMGYGGKLVEYIGTYDLVFNYPIYLLFTFIDKFTKLKVFLLKLIGK